MLYTPYVSCDFILHTSYPQISQLNLLNSASMSQFLFSENSPGSDDSGPYIVETPEFCSYQNDRGLEGDHETSYSFFPDLAVSSCHSPSLIAGYYAHELYLDVLHSAGSPAVGIYDAPTPPPFDSGSISEAPLDPSLTSSYPYLDPELQQPQQSPLSHFPSPRRSTSQSPSFRSESPDAGDLSKYGIPNADRTWRCAYPGCSSRTPFIRACDLRKHFNRHNKYLFCRHEGCPQAAERGFSSKKDRARHEAKHNPEITCQWKGCGRVFSRMDNMKDHVRRIHQKRRRTIE
jgi:hypothetical protein